MSLIGDGYTKSLKEHGVDGWDKHEVEGSPDWLIFTKDCDDCFQCFNFKCFCLASSEITNRLTDGTYQTYPDEYELVLHGYALFDGVRHMWFGEDEESPNGYINYPDLISLAKTILKLDEIQVEKLEYIKEERKKK